MSYNEDIDDLDLDEDEDLPKNKRNSKRKERTVFSVWEIDTHNDKVPAYCAYESFGNPIPALRYAAKLNVRGKRHKYIVSPRPTAASIRAANV